MSEKGERRRSQLNTIVSDEMKTRITQLAEEQGRSQGQVVELLLERAFDYDELLAGLNTTLERIRQGHLERALEDAGYFPIRTGFGKAWYPPGHPLLHGRSGLEARDKGDHLNPAAEALAGSPLQAGHGTPAAEALTVGSPKADPQRQR
jgi:predicted DNA-binding protein